MATSESGMINGIRNGSSNGAKGRVGTLESLFRLNFDGANDMIFK